MNILDKFGPVAQFLVSISVLTSFFGVVWMLLTNPLDFTNSVRDILLILVGVLAGAFKDVVGFYLGSSMSSQSKDLTIKAMQTDSANVANRSAGTK